jgi:hypothetical protein
MLGELRTTMERRAENDNLLIKSLTRIGSSMAKVDDTFNLMDRTLSGIDRSNQRSLATMQKLGERVEESDRVMAETFARLRDAEREFTDYIAKSSRRGGLAMLGVCSILMMSVVAVGFMFKENRELLTAVQRNGSLVVQVPGRSQPEGVAILEELEQVDDGIGEPDRELAAVPAPRAEGAAPDGEGGEGAKPLLSATEPESARRGGTHWALHGGDRCESLRA